MTTHVFSYKNLWCAALAEHQRSWTQEKAAADAASKKDAQKLATYFQLNRGKRADWNNLFAELNNANNFARLEKADILDLSEIVRRIARLNENKFSGASKFLWHSQGVRFQSNWTLFDRLALTGISLRDLKLNPTERGDLRKKIRELENPSDTEKNFVSFYFSLRALNFEKFIGEILDCREECEGHPSRVFDKALMILGRQKSYRVLKHASESISEVDAGWALRVSERTSNTSLGRHLISAWALEKS